MPGVRYIHFDFHKQCSKMRWENLGILMGQIQDDLDKFGYFYKDGNGERAWDGSGVLGGVLGYLDYWEMVRELQVRGVRNLDYWDIRGVMGI